MRASTNAPTKRDLILRVLLDYREHSGTEFLRGTHGFYVASYSQRIGDLVKAGYVIRRVRCGRDGLGVYRLIATPHERAARR